MKRGILFVLLIVSMLLGGCGDSKDKKGNAKENIQYKFPKYDKEVIITDLHNVDMEFYYGQYNCVCDFRLISTKELEIDNINISFDSDIAYRLDIQEDESEENTFFDYNLFLAYNSMKSKDGMSYVKDLPIEEYKKIEEEIPELYSYSVFVYFEAVDPKTDEIQKYDDNIINNITVEYGSEKYIYDIGKIEIKDNEKISKSEDANDVQSGFSHTMDTINYNTEGEFSVYAPRFINTQSSPVKIVDAEFVNGTTYSFSHLNVMVSNENHSYESIWRKGDELTIPVDTEVSLDIVGTSDKLTNSIGFKVAPILKVTVEIDGELCELYYETTGTVYSFNKYEIYAYLIDGVDIFTSYYNVKSGGQ